MSRYPRVSIIVATYNRKEILDRALAAITTQRYASPYEVIVVDDGSSDGTPAIARKHPVRFFQQQHGGPDVVKNFGIGKARYEVIVIMDDDCIPEKTWLHELVGELIADKRRGGVSSYTPTGGTSTAFYKKDLDRIGVFDLQFNRYNFRDDTDLVFRLMDDGKEFYYVDDKAFFEHAPKRPRGKKGVLRYFQKRLWIHSVDPLLYKKHPQRTKQFLDIKWGFIRNPLHDFRAATGMWHKDVDYSLSSPQGITILENRSPLHGVAIFFAGLGYLSLVKLYRLYGSIKYGKMLV